MSQNGQATPLERELWAVPSRSSRVSEFVDPVSPPVKGTKKRQPPKL